MVNKKIVHYTSFLFKFGKFLPHFKNPVNVLMSEAVNNARNLLNLVSAKKCRSLQ